MKTALSFIFTIAFLAAAIGVSAQVEQITEAQFEAARSAALEKASQLPRRVVTSEKFFEGQELKGRRDDVSEISASGDKHRSVTENFDGKPKTDESISLAEQVFCKRHKKDWKRSDGPCPKTPELNVPAGSYQYSVETDAADPSRKIYRKWASFGDTVQNDPRDAVRMKYVEFKFAVDSEGMVEQTETRRGGMESAEWSSTRITKYELAPNGVRIRVPTTKN